MSEFQTRDYIGYMLMQLARRAWYSLIAAYTVAILTLLGYILSHF